MRWGVPRRSCTDCHPGRHRHCQCCEAPVVDEESESGLVYIWITCSAVMRRYAAMAWMSASLVYDRMPTAIRTGFAIGMCRNLVGEDMKWTD